MEKFFRNKMLTVITVFLFTIIHAKANNYYFSSSSGDDARTNMQAQNAATPWKTIDKLNAFINNINPGDSILFRAGDIFFGVINVKKSGTVLSPIVFASYGDGENAVISCLNNISTWKNAGNGIYESACPDCISGNNILSINGNPQAIGRYPNSGYLTYQAHINNSAIVDNTLGDQTNWQGADIVIKKKHWIIDRSNIVSQQNGTINYAAGTSSTPTDNYGYFIQNDIRTLDQFGEWFFDSSSKKMSVYFGNQNPNGFITNASTANILVNINGQSFIQFNNLSFEGANTTSFKIRNAKNISIQNCSINFSGGDAINASGAPSLLIENSFINHSQNDAITIDSSCRLAVIQNNKITNTGLMPGMGKNGTGTYQAISASGANTVIQFNEIDSTGYDGIFFGANFSIAKNNFIQNFCCIKDDGAGIYIDDWFPSTGKKITGNIIINGVGSIAGTNTKYTSQLQVEGIYIDDKTADVVIDSNTVSNCPHAGIMIHNAHDIKITNNTVFNNGIQLLLQHDNLWPNNPIRNVIANNNFFFCKTVNQICVNVLWLNDDAWQFGNLDSNFYYHPDENKIFQSSANIWTSRNATKNFSFSDWQKNNAQDLHSKKVINNTADSANFQLEYNSSNKIKSISLSGFAVGVSSTNYADHFSVLPYHSIIISKEQISYH